MSPVVNDEAVGVLDAASHPTSYWSTTNVGEAMPGVPTPLCWSVWGPAAELATRGPFHLIGALESGDMPADERDRVISIFSGRVAARVDFLGQMGDRMPGITGPALVEQFLGVVPDDMRFAPTKRYYPAIAAGFPRAALKVRKQLFAESDNMKRWWPEQLARIPTLDLAATRRLFAEADRNFRRCVLVQSYGMFLTVQPTYDQLLRLIQRADAGHLAGALMGGGGDHAETEIVVDLWDVGRGRLPLDAFIGRHGYHGPLEGEISGRVWREDPAPVVRLAGQYAACDDEADPRAQAALRDRKRVEAERELLGAVPALQHPVAQLVLRLARRNSNLRGIGKGAFLRAMDVARATARHAGDLLADQGLLADPEDVFYLTAEELTGDLPEDLPDTIGARRSERARLERLELPPTWQGVPTPIAATSDDAPATRTFEGVAASGGVVEGIARVVIDPAFTDVEPDEILVAPTTDPSWASIMFLSLALVVDIGGHLSHAAIVARELGIPCVVDTRTGSKQIKTGDRLRVDGDRGIVEVLDA